MAVVDQPSPAQPPPPPLADLGLDLLHINHFQRVMAVVLPVALVGMYIALAYFRVWPLAVLTLMYLSFVTYGSISHDLVHRTLGLSHRWNDFFLSVIELMAFRSGHAYRLAHLHHHARFPHEDDIEGGAAKMSLMRTLAEGVIFQPKIMAWAARRHWRQHPVVVVEMVLVVAGLAICIVTMRWTPIFAVYAALMIMGSWIIPLITVFLPHNAQGQTALSQTRLFRGKIASIVAMEHLYHLEHHLYPMVPHHNWAKLARRLDPYLKEAGVEAIVLGF